MNGSDTVILRKVQFFLVIGLVLVALRGQKYEK